MAARPLALVTGGCHRLGATIAARLAAAGWDLALHGQRHSEPEAGLVEALTRAGAAWTVTTADLADPDAARDIMARVVKEWGRAPTLLVNSAATFGQDRLETVTAKDLQRHYAVNCASPALLTAAFAALAPDGAAPGERSIVNILDQRIVQPHGDQLAYTLSKLALAGLTEITARDLAPAIRVNAVAPGLTLPTRDYDDDRMTRLAGMMPLQRLPLPSEVADAVVYLARARAVTGQTIFVDGGARFENWPRDFMHLDGD